MDSEPLYFKEALRTLHTLSRLSDNINLPPSTVSPNSKSSSLVSLDVSSTPKPPHSYIAALYRAFDLDVVDSSASLDTNVHTNATPPLNAPENRGEEAALMADYQVIRTLRLKEWNLNTLMSKLESDVDKKDDAMPPEVTSWWHQVLATPHDPLTHVPPTLIKSEPTDTSGQLVVVVLHVGKSRGLLCKNGVHGNTAYCEVSVMDGMRGHSGEPSNGTQVYSSPVVSEDTGSPDFGFQAALCLKLEQSVQIKVCLWTKLTDPVAKAKRKGKRAGKDAFLGQVHLSLPEIKSMLHDAPASPNLAPLKERSRWSHVSGSISLLLSPVAEPEDLDRVVLQVIPANPVSSFRQITQRILYSDALLKTKDCDVFPSEVARGLLDYLARTWLVARSTALTIEYEICSGLLYSNQLSASLFYLSGFRQIVTLLSTPVDGDDKLVSLTRNKLGELFDYIKEKLGNFFVPTVDQTRARDLKALCVMFLEFQSPPLCDDTWLVVDPEKYVANVLKESLRHRFQRMENKAQISSKARALPLLLSIFLSVNDDLTSFQTHLDFMLLEFIHLPSIAAKLYFSELEAYLDMFTKTFNAENPVLVDVLDLYHAVRKMLHIYDAIDFKIAEKFKIDSWFLPFVEKWLQVTDARLMEWVQNALNVDTFEKLSSTQFYSSSILDIFTCFTQQIEFLNELAWPNRLRAESFMNRLTNIILEACQKYMKLLRQALVKELVTLRAMAKDGKDGPVRGDSANTGNASVMTPKIATLPKLRGAKLKFSKTAKLQALDPSSLRASSKVAVMLNNFHAIQARFKDMLRCVPVYDEKCEELVAKPRAPKFAPTSSSSSLPPNLALEKSRYAPVLFYKLTVRRGELFPMTRPLYAFVSCQILSGSGKAFGRTQWVPHNHLPNWEDESIILPLMRRDVMSGLELDVYFSQRKTLGPPGPDEMLMARFKIPCDSFDAVQFDVSNGGGEQALINKELVLDEGDKGQVYCAIAGLYSCACGAVLDALSLASTTAFKSAAREVIDKLLGDLRSKLKLVSEKYKQPKGLAGFVSKINCNVKSRISVRRSGEATPLYTSKSHGSLANLTSNSHAQFEQDLEPILIFLNSNLETLAENMPDETLHLFVGELWLCVVDVLESLLVYGLGENLKEKVPWEKGRLEFAQGALEILKNFFHSNGDGVPLEELEMESYKQLVFLMECYCLPDAELVVAYNCSVESKHRPSIDTILKLYNLRHMREAFEAGMVQRFYA